MGEVISAGKGLVRQTFGEVSSALELSAQGFLNEQRVLATRSDPLDDLFGALASFQLRVGGQGSIEPIRQQDGTVIGHRIHLRRLGVFARDSYDSNDDSWSWKKPKDNIISQPLGWWGFAGIEKISPSLFGPELGDECIDNGENPDEGKYRINNETFRDYRAKNNRGRDFVVYSDIDWLDADVTFEIAE